MPMIYYRFNTILERRQGVQRIPGSGTNYDENPRVKFFHDGFERVESGRQAFSHQECIFKGEKEIKKELTKRSERKNDLT